MMDSFRKADAFSHIPRRPDLSDLFQATKRRRYFVGGAVTLFILFVLSRLHSRPASTPLPIPKDSTWEYPRDAKNFRLTPRQCDAAFPGLSYEVTRAVRDRNGKRITIEELDEIPKRNGYVRGMIFDNELYILDAEGQIYSRGLATLLSLNRAIVTSPEPLPNIEFTFSTDDWLPPQAQWAYARKIDDHQTWVMPDFGFYSWPETKVGAYGEVQSKAIAMEESAANPSGQAWPWDLKIPQLLWRGATMGLPLREALIDIAKDKLWSDVRTLDWHDKNSTDNDLKSTDQHCQYKFLAHTEGNSYSGRLKYLQNCRSVIVAHTMDWFQHFSFLMSSSGETQNYVEVRRDYSDLEKTVKSLIENDEEAKRIADNSVKTFRERYLTPSAEACYWRSLIRGWKDVMGFEPKIWGMDPSTGEMKRKGVPLESYILERRLDWNPY